MTVNADGTWSIKRFTHQMFYQIMILKRKVVSLVQMVR